MSAAGEDLVATMRRAFDEAFAHPQVHPDDEPEQLIGLRAGDKRYAVRLKDLGALHARPPVTPLPGGAAALIGVASVRGEVVAIYDLAMLLGGPDDRLRARWIVTARGAPTFAFAFAELEEHHRAGRVALVPAVGPHHPALAELLLTGETGIGVVRLDALLSADVHPEEENHP